MTCIWGVIVDRCGKIRWALEGAFSGRLGTTASGLLDGIKPSDVGVGFDKFAFAGSDLHVVLNRVHVRFCDGFGCSRNPESSAVGHVLSNPTARRCRSNRI